MICTRRLLTGIGIVVAFAVHRVPATADTINGTGNLAGWSWGTAPPFNVFGPNYLGSASDNALYSPATGYSGFVSESIASSYQANNFSNLPGPSFTPFVNGTIFAKAGQIISVDVTWSLSTPDFSGSSATFSVGGIGISPVFSSVAGVTTGSSSGTQHLTWVVPTTGNFKVSASVSPGSNVTAGVGHGGYASVSFQNLTVVPEPGTFVMAAAGLPAIAAVSWCRRRRNRLAR